MEGTSWVHREKKSPFHLGQGEGRPHREARAVGLGFAEWEASQGQRTGASPRGWPCFPREDHQREQGLRGRMSGGRRHRHVVLRDRRHKQVGPGPCCPTQSRDGLHPVAAGGDDGAGGGRPRQQPGASTVGSCSSWREIVGMPDGEYELPGGRGIRGDGLQSGSLGGGKSPDS